MYLYLRGEKENKMELNINTDDFVDAIGLVDPDCDSEIKAIEDQFNCKISSLKPFGSHNTGYPKLLP